MNMSCFWEGYVQTVMVIQFIILDNVFKNVLHKLSLMDTLVFNVLSRRFGMELIVLTDVQLVKYGFREIVCVQSTMNGMDTTAHLALEESHGMSQPESVHAPQLQSGTVSHVSPAMVVECSKQYQKLAFAHPVQHGAVTHA